MDGLEALHNLYQHGRFVTINLGEEPRFKGCTTHRVDVIPVAIWLDCGLGNEDVERTASNLLVKCSQLYRVATHLTRRLRRALFFLISFLTFLSISHKSLHGGRLCLSTQLFPFLPPCFRERGNKSAKSHTWQSRRHATAHLTARYTSTNLYNVFPSLVLSKSSANLPQPPMGSALILSSCTTKSYHPSRGKRPPQTFPPIATFKITLQSLILLVPLGIPAFMTGLPSIYHTSLPPSPFSG
jgi:hypothetical protein